MKKYVITFAVFFGLYVLARVVENKVPFIKNLTARLGA